MNNGMTEQSISEDAALLWLNHLPFFSPRMKNELLRIFGSGRDVYTALGDPDILSHMKEKHLVKEESLAWIRKDHCLSWFDWLKDRLIKTGIRFVTRNSAEYPGCFASLAASEWDERPLAVFYQGNLSVLSHHPSIGIVGSRITTDYGNQVTDHFAREFARKGIPIISGLAAGTDGRAHRRALEQECGTVAVLGCGCNVCYPSENRILYENIRSRGLLISEYMPDEQPLGWHFPQRNRLIASIADSLLVTAARTRSGSLITARQALQYGKNVYAVPGRISDPGHGGCNELVRDAAAMLVTSPADILTDMAGDRLTVMEEKIFLALCYRGSTAGEIYRKAGVDPGKGEKALQNLEKKHLLIRKDSQYFVHFPRYGKEVSP